MPIFAGRPAACTGRACAAHVRAARAARAAAGAAALAVAVVGLQGCGGPPAPAGIAGPGAEPSCDELPKARCVNWRFECLHGDAAWCAERADTCERQVVVSQSSPSGSVTCLTDPAPAGAALPGPALCVAVVESNGTEVPAEAQTVVSCRQDGPGGEVRVVNCSSPTPGFCASNATSACEEALGSPGGKYSMCSSGHGCGTEFYCAGGGCDEGAVQCLGPFGNRSAPAGDLLSGSGHLASAGAFLQRARP